MVVVENESGDRMKNSEKNGKETVMLKREQAGQIEKNKKP